MVVVVVVVATAAVAVAPVAAVDIVFVLYFNDAAASAGGIELVALLSPS